MKPLSEILSELDTDRGKEVNHEMTYYQLLYVCTYCLGVRTVHTAGLMPGTQIAGRMTDLRQVTDDARWTTMQDCTQTCTRMKRQETECYHPSDMEELFSK